MVMNKKGDYLVLELTIFIVLNVSFFVIMLIFIRGSTNNDLIYEQTYAKQIALFIDNAKPGMDMVVDVSELYTIASANRFTGNVIRIDNKNRRVFVNLVPGRGYSYGYFVNSSIIWDLNKNTGKLLMSMK